MLKKRRVYVNSLYEQEKDFVTGKVKETFYIFGGDGLVAIRIKDNTSDKVSYVHKDHLGSIQCLTDDAGALAQEMSYDAWGNRRDADTWGVYTTPQSGLITDRGFTGHEHMDLFDLVNMNGRVYDPVIGRFLSADPIIQNPENLQSLNRYSYCLNNPLSLTDPSGYSWLSNNWRSLAGAAIGIAATIVTAGLLAPAGLATLTVWGATAAGAVGGFAGGFSGTLLNGGDLGQAFKAGVVGGVVGGASGFLAFAAGGVTGNSIGAILERMGRHAFANAWLAGMQGQNMFSSALTGGASSLGGAGLTSLNIENVGLLAAGNAVIGGTVSVIGGGKFANGAVTGAFTMLFNELAHKARYSSAKFKAQLKSTYEYFSKSSKLIDEIISDPKVAFFAKSAFFASKVKTGAEFDIKSTSFNEEKLGGKFAIFEGAKMAPDDFGNYNYGVAAKAMGFSLSWAKFGAGMSQTFLQNGNDWSNWWGFFDFRSDTEMIKKGYNRFE